MSTEITTEQALRIEPQHPASIGQPRVMSRSVRLLGFWSAILAAIFSVGWFVARVIQDAVSPIPVLHNAQAYVEALNRIQVLNFYPSLLLAPTFIVLMVCIHLYASPEKQVWSLIGLAIGVVYATMATINYQIQLVSVQQSLLNGESAGMEMFIQSNPHSIVTALANSYVYMCVAMVFAAPVFEGGRLERWIRWLFFAMGPVAVAQLAWSLFDLSAWVVVVSGVVWIVGAVVAFVLLGVLFKRTEQTSHTTTP